MVVGFWGLWRLHFGNMVMTGTARRDDDDREGLTRWLNEARRGNKEAFGRLCGTDSWQRWLIGIASSLPPHLRGKVDPEDVLIEALEQAWRDLGGLKDVSTQGFHRWVSGICRHRLVDFVRHHERPRRDVRREETLLSSARDAASGDDHTPSKSAYRHEQLTKIASVLDELPGSYRAVIGYRILEGHTTAETAEMMGKTPANVGVTLHRALTRLRELLAEHRIDSTIFRPL